MRVTHVITRLIVGGAQENTVASVLGLRRKPDLEVQLISGPTTGPEGSLESRFAASPGTLRIIPELVRPVRPWKDWRAFRRLTRVLSELHADLVHTHSGKAGVLGRLAAARAGVPMIVHTVHGPSFGAFQGPLANLVFRGAERCAAKVTTHFVVVADAMAQQYLGAGIGRPEQYTRIYSGFETERFLTATNDLQLRARLGIAPDDFVVGKLARLTKLKGHDDLFAVAPALVRQWPKTRFLLVGEGELRGRFEAQARELGLEQYFIFTGLVPPEEVPALLGIMDVVAHLSAREGLARALPQALAAGRPVVAYNSDGAGEVCLDEQTGYLLAPGNLAGLGQRFLQLARSSELRHRLGERGRELVRARFGTERMVDELHGLYLRLAAARQRVPVPTP